MKKLTNAIRNFINSDIYIYVIFAFTVLAWYLKIQVIAMSIYVAVLLLIILLDVKRINIITLIMGTVINFREDRMEANVKIMLIFAIILIPIILYDLIRRKPKFTDQILVAMLIFLGVNILSLVNTNKDTIILALVGVGQVVLYVVIYLYFFSYYEEGDKIKIGKNAMVMGMSIFLELVLLLISLRGKVISKSSIDLGWGLSNYMAITVNVLIPLTFYVYLENQKHKEALITVLLEIIVVILTFSKGAILTLALVAIPFYICGYLFIKDKKKFVKESLLCLLIMGISFAVIASIKPLWNAFINYFEAMNSRGWFNDPSRIKIYKKGLELLKSHPLLGVGPYTGQYYLENNINYHNYIVQTLATLGLLGLGSFCYYLYTIIKRLVSTNRYHLMVFFVIIIMCIHGLVDTTWYNPLIMVIVSFYTAALQTKTSFD